MPGQSGILAAVMALVKKNDDKMFLYTRIASAAALVIGTVNALLVYYSGRV